MNEKLAELTARNAGATHRNPNNPFLFYRQGGDKTEWTVYDNAAKSLEQWRYFDIFPPKWAEQL